MQLAKAMEFLSSRRVRFQSMVCSPSVLMILIVLLGGTTVRSHAQSSEWTWMGGTGTLGTTGSQLGVYGTLGTPAPGNHPGGRSSTVGWTDSQGNLWLFGGNDYYYFNDLWKLDLGTNEWTWMGGSSNPVPSDGLLGQTGVYGTMGTAAAANIPGGRGGSVAWTDPAGRFWLFGGYGVSGTVEIESPYNYGYLNDLWSYDPKTGQWTWISGSNSFQNTAGQAGNYGVQGTAGSGNLPGGRRGAVSWIDSAGNLWLFGGNGVDSAGTVGPLNDIWKFDPGSGQWTWISGSEFVETAGSYGTKLVSATGDSPGGRSEAAAWTDKQGNFWLFGGYGLDANGSLGYLNDLWQFSPSSGIWTWMGGASSLGSASGESGTYGIWKTSGAQDTPGGRKLATSWVDATGNLWLFGGFGFDQDGTYGYLNDLWEFNPISGQWTWMGGSSALAGALTNSPAAYGTLGVSDFLNTPGGREGALSWTDGTGTPWLYGGFGLDSNGNLGNFDDWWKLQQISGGPAQAQSPQYSIPSGSYPAGQSVSISDATTGATIYYQVDGSTAPVAYSQPISIASTETINAVAVAPGYSVSAVTRVTYTIPAAAAPTSSIGSGTYSNAQIVALTDATPGATIYYAVNGNVSTSSTVYSGPITVSSSEQIAAMAVSPGYVGSPTSTLSIVIWPTPSTNEWAWMTGASSKVEASIPGNMGTPALSNTPGARENPANWTDKTGNLWLFGGASGTYLNDLWRYSVTTGEWTWMGGSLGRICEFDPTDSATCSKSISGVYGKMGVASGSNVPGGRTQASTWTDADGNFWLFGGHGADSAGTLVYLNDLWEFSPATKEWMWVSGTSRVTGTCFVDSGGDTLCGGEPGSYGSLGVPGATNLPGAREGATTWVDASGNLWLFGGYTIDAKNEALYQFNDLWKFNIVQNEWTWMGGSGSFSDATCMADPNSPIPFCGVAGVSGTFQSAAAGNAPGSRRNAAGWTDSNGNLWLFGGMGWDANPNGTAYSALNDVWRFDPNSKEWAWMGGASVAPLCGANFNDNCGNVPMSPWFGNQGTKGVPAPGNIPSLIEPAAHWKDAEGNFWLLSNDLLWEFNPAANEWAWMGGGGSPYGNYGTRGVPSTTNNPGLRLRSQGWTDASGDLWLFGGLGYNAMSISDLLNDLWEFRPQAPAPLPSFSLVALPAPGDANANLQFHPGSALAIPIEVLPGAGFNSPVTLSASGTPDGVTVSWSATSITGVGTSNLTTTIGTNAAPGSYSITITGAGGGQTDSISIPLVVQSGAPPEFSISTSPGSLTVNSGGQGTAKITIAPQLGFGSQVSFSCAGLPSGATCSFSPATITPDGRHSATTTLTIAASASGAMQHEPRPWLPVGALSLAGLLLWRRPRWKIGFWLAVLIASFGLSLLSACGGGSPSSSSGTGGGGSGGGSSPTPSISTITITGTAGSLQESTVLTLTLN